MKSSENNSENGKIPESPLDWELIEREYRAGQLSVVEVGRISRLQSYRDKQTRQAPRVDPQFGGAGAQEVSARLVSDGVSAASLNEAVDRVGSARRSNRP